MKTAHRLASLAKRRHLAGQINPQDLPKFWRGKTTTAQALDCRLIHWDLIDRFTSGTADRTDLWDWMETGFTYSQLMHLLTEDGTAFTPEALTAVAEQLQTYDAVANRYARTGRVGFSAAELLTARAAAEVFDSLIGLDRNGLAEQAAIWSTEQMARISRKAALGVARAARLHLEHARQD